VPLLLEVWGFFFLGGGGGGGVELPLIFAVAHISLDHFTPLQTDWVFI